MYFAREQDMYEPITRYLEQRGYHVVADKPRGTGLRFRSLKGWTIDVAALRKGQEPELIAVEVKKGVGSSAVLDALSKAEVYRNICTRAYVAFPRTQYRSARNKLVAGEIHQECERRGIGILEVGKRCEVALKAVPSTLRVDMQREIIGDLIRRTTKRFEGFEVADFARYNSGIDDGIVWHRFGLLARSLELRLRSRGLVLTHRPKKQKGKWWYSFSRRLPTGQKYYHVPHFTLSFWENGIMGEMIVRSGRHLNALKRQAVENPRAFATAIVGLRKSRYPCELKVQNRRNIGPYKTEVVSEFTVKSNYVGRAHVKRLGEFLREESEGTKQWLWIGHLFGLEEKETGSPRLVNCVGEFVDSLVQFYGYLLGIAE